MSDTVHNATAARRITTGGRARRPTRLRQLIRELDVVCGLPPILGVEWVEKRGLFSLPDARLRHTPLKLASMFPDQEWKVLG